MCLDLWVVGKSVYGDLFSLLLVLYKVFREIGLLGCFSIFFLKEDLVVICVKKKGGVFMFCWLKLKVMWLF